MDLYYGYLRGKWNVIEVCKFKKSWRCKGCCNKKKTEDLYITFYFWKLLDTKKTTWVTTSTLIILFGFHSLVLAFYLSYIKKLGIWLDILESQPHPRMHVNPHVYEYLTQHVNSHVYEYLIHMCITWTDTTNLQLLLGVI